MRGFLPGSVIPSMRWTAIPRLSLHWRVLGASPHLTRILKAAAFNITVLSQLLGTDLHVLAYENGFVVSPKPAVVQRICAIRGSLPDAGQKQNFFLNS